MLTDIANKIQQSKFHWTDVALQIGIDKNDILKIKKKNNSTLEFVNSVTHKLWDELLNSVGLNVPDNNFTEISSIAKLTANLSGYIEKGNHHVKVKNSNAIENIKATNIENRPTEKQTEVATSSNVSESIQVADINIQETNIENEITENPREVMVSNIDGENIQANEIGSKETESEADRNNYDQHNTYIAEILRKDTYNNENVQVIHEVSNRISQWRMFGRILNLKESFLNQLQTDCSSSSERNHKIIDEFSMPLQPNQSWMFWRQYLDEFEDGKLVIEEMEGTFIDLLPQIQNTIDHIVTSDRLTYVGHPFHYKANKDYVSLDKENKIICVRIGSKDFQFAHYQDFSEWIETQKHYMDTYNMLNELKSINFVNDNICPILQTLENFLDATNDSGFVMKGYNFVNHFCLFKQGVFAKDVFNDSYLCFFANDNVVLYLTKCSKGPCHALHHSLRNVQIANILHRNLQSNNVTQINVIIHDETNDFAKFCKQCIENGLFVHEETFVNPGKLALWYNKLITKNNIQNKINQVKDLSTNGNEICNIIKKDIITYQVLETSNLPSFSYCPEDQMDELKKLVVLSPNQFKVLHSNKKHILLRGSYGCGKSLVLFKKCEQVINNMNNSDIVYFICNDQQSDFIQSMKILQSRYHMKSIIICRSDELSPGGELSRETEIIPKLSFILNHIKHVWKDKTVHILIDEFSGSYFNNSEIEDLKNLLHNFQSSYIIVVLQSMEQNIVEVENNIFTNLGYQFSELTKKTSFTCFNLDYSLRNSMEINEFVKATSETLELSTVSVPIAQNFSDNTKLIDSETAMENLSSLFKDASIITAGYKYNQNESIGHGVKSGLVNVYHRSSRKIGEIRERFLIYFSTLEYILKDISEINKYVICTYDIDAYQAIQGFLETSLLDCTINLKEFLKPNSIFNVLLTDHAAVRGYEFNNFIFLLPLGKQYLKYRMLECFTRCTTRLHIISDETNVKNDSIDHQLIMKWKELNCVYFIDCSYDKSADKVFLVHNDIEIYCKENANEAYKKISSERFPSGLTTVFSVKSVDVSRVQDHISSDLRFIVSMDNIPSFKEFINLHKIDVCTYCDFNVGNLLHIASKHDAVSISQILINDYEIDVNSDVKFRDTPLYLAANNGSSNVTNILLKNGADANIKSKYGETPLHKSSYNGYINIVQLLLNNGADVNVKDMNGNTPLHVSLYKSHINIVRLLLNNRADVNAKNKQDETPLHVSSLIGCINIVQLLLDNGADVNVKNKFDKTPLHKFSSKGYKNIVRLLLDNGADDNVKDKCGYTPLHKSPFSKSIRIVHLRLDNGANVNIKDRDGE